MFSPKKIYANNNDDHHDDYRNNNIDTNNNNKSGNRFYYYLIFFVIVIVIFLFFMYMNGNISLNTMFGNNSNNINNVLEEKVKIFNDMQKKLFNNTIN